MSAEVPELRLLHCGGDGGTFTVPHRHNAKNEDQKVHRHKSAVAFNVIIGACPRRRLARTGSVDTGTWGRRPNILEKQLAICRSVSGRPAASTKARVQRGRRRLPRADTWGRRPNIPENQLAISVSGRPAASDAQAHTWAASKYTPSKYNGEAPGDMQLRAGQCCILVISAESGGIGSNMSPGRVVRTGATYRLIPLPYIWTPPPRIGAGQTPATTLNATALLCLCISNMTRRRAAYRLAPLRMSDNLRITGGGRVLDFAVNESSDLIIGFNGPLHGGANQRWILEPLPERVDPTAPTRWTMLTQAGHARVNLQGGLRNGAPLSLDVSGTPFIFSLFAHARDPTAIVFVTVADDSHVVVDLEGGRVVNANSREVTLAGFNPSTRSPANSTTRREGGEGEWIDITKKYLDGAPIFDPAA
ncbi:hypothetical protein GGX14DRAFT_397503 [Mycena pura]|uniref:Uncharacterized protein n=1 Tax=Mycena pura TaxID=153505 RepID=A0AAD6YAK3_9AGAR|nr:hypothetical protein GGX14DRAFT_397503 [Mycena pura]